MNTIYNVSEIIDKKLTDENLKKIINIKLFNIIKLIEFS